MAAEALAAEAVASRLERQEEDIRWLWAEVQRLRDELQTAPDRCQAEGPCLTREVAQLRAENRDLRHRLYRLRLCLAEELSHQAKLESAARAAAAGAQVTGRRTCLRGPGPGERGGRGAASPGPGRAGPGAGAGAGGLRPRPAACPASARWSEGWNSLRSQETACHTPSSVPEMGFPHV